MTQTLNRSLCQWWIEVRCLSLLHFFQELQHEVSSLLEFKNALLETFPHLQGKLGQQGQLSPRSGVGSGRASTSTLRGDVGGGSGGGSDHASTVESPRVSGGAGATATPASVAGGAVRNGPVRTDQVRNCRGWCDYDDESPAEMSADKKELNCESCPSV